MTPAKGFWESAEITSDEEPQPGCAWLRIEAGATLGNVDPTEAVRIRDGLRRAGGKAEERLATIIDAKATELLAAPLYAGTVSIRIDREEEQCLLALLTAWIRDGSIANTEADNLGRLCRQLTLASGERDTGSLT